MYCNYLDMFFYFNISEYWKLVRFINEVRISAK